MMGIVVPETCWAYKKYNKIISSLYLVLILQFIIIYLSLQFCFAALQHSSGVNRLIVEVFRSHTFRLTHTNTHLVGLWSNDQPVAKVATYTTHNKHVANIHALSGIRTRDQINQAAAYLSLRQHG